ncbi:MAG TPA: O-methyltransferase [Vitreimonas sp.]|nr:O-methyltransferase [Vitreimonas sp.]
MKDERGWIPTQTDLDWIDGAAAPVHPVLLEMEALANRADVPIVDRDSGRVLSVLATGRQRIVEVGTAIGYSTLWLALGQPAGGTIVTIDPDTGRTDRARRWWREAGIDDGQIIQVTGRALEAFAADEAALAGPFDLAFIDALKPEYGDYLEAIVPRLAPAALVVADNVLWSGRVSGDRPSQPGDEHVEALRSFDRQLLRDPRFNATILPVGDGLLIAGYRP